MDQTDKPFIVLKAFIRGLSHSLRTPLSTISNELHYLESLHGGSEFSRSREKCKEISDLLRELEVISIPASSDLIPAIDVLAPFKGITEDILIDKFVKNGQSVKRALELVMQFFQKKLLNDLNEQIIESSQSSLKLTLAADVKLTDTKKGNFESLTNYCSNILDIDSQFMALAESLLWSAGCTLEVIAFDSIYYSITIPTYEQSQE